MRDIKEIRNDIDKVDAVLKEYFVKRLELSKEMKEYKIANNLNILDEKREKEILDRMKNDELYSIELRDFSKYLLTVSKSLMNK